MATHADVAPADLNIFMLSDFFSLLVLFYLFVFLLCMCLLVKFYIS